MELWREVKGALLHMLFPHICCGCGSDIIGEESCLCMSCINSLPFTKFHLHKDNPIEKIFWGRLPIKCATAQFFFTKHSLMQRLLHQLKYKDHRALGVQLGRLMGGELTDAPSFQNIDTLVALPLFPLREKRRGYNQAALLCEGIAEITGWQILNDVVQRVQHTETQTRKSRMERWENMQGKFSLIDSGALQHRNVLLVDDVITTGATLEACGSAILEGSLTSLSIATLCTASR